MREVGADGDGEEGRLWDAEEVAVESGVRGVRGLGREARAEG